MTSSRNIAAVSLLVGGIGGVAGILLGFQVIYLKERLVHTPFTFVSDMVVISFLFSASEHGQISQTIDRTFGGLQIR